MITIIGCNNIQFPKNVSLWVSECDGDRPILLSSPNREIAGQSADNYLATFPCNNPALSCFVRVKTSEPSLWWQWWWSGWHSVRMNPLVVFSLALVPMVTEVESSPNWRWQRAHASLLSSMESPATQWQHDNLRTIRQTPSSCLLSSSQLSVRYRPRLSKFLTKKRTFPKRIFYLNE